MPQFPGAATAPDRQAELAAFSSLLQKREAAMSDAEKRLATERKVIEDMKNQYKKQAKSSSGPVGPTAMAAAKPGIAARTSAAAGATSRQCMVEMNGVASDCLLM